MAGNVDSQIASQGTGILRILVVRPDRLGDVVLSTPVFEVIKRHYPKSNLTVMVKKNVVPIVRRLSSVDEVMIFEQDARRSRHAGVKGFFRLVRDIRSGQFRIAIVLKTHWKIAAAIFLAGVRYRIGPLGKPHSFLFFNRGIRQRRSHVEMHETDYNLQLLRRIGIRVGTRNVPTKVFVSEEKKTHALEWLRSQGWKNDHGLVAVHPGMGGSALNWPEGHYIDLIRALVRENRQVVVTGGRTEEHLLARVREGVGSALDGVMFFGGASAGAVDELAGLYSWADVVVAPSTGPLHLALALGKPVVTFYSPIRVQSAIRWGPYVPDGSKVFVNVPEVYCGQEFECLKQLCNYYPCMKGLTVSQALMQVRAHLNNFSQDKSVTGDQAS